MNKNKNLIVIIVIVLVLIGGYIALSSKNSENSDAQNTNTPTGGNVAKINIDVVCEGALAYMTFPDSASADQFVAECKAGEHPEVIEQWKQNQGITDDKAI